MKSVIVAMAMVLVVGCAGVSRVPLNEQTSGRQLVMTTISDPHAFAPTVQRSWLEVCDVKAIQWTETDKFILGNWYYEYANCAPQGEVQANTATGYVAGMVAPLIYSGAMVGSAALIGDGLSKSGPTVNQSGGGAKQNQTNTQNQTVNAPGSGHGGHK